MHPDATDSSRAGLSTAPAVGTPGERRPESREDAAAPRGPGGRSWRVPVAVAALSAVSLSYLGPGCWQDAGGAGPCTVLLRLSLYLGCTAAAFLLGTLFSLVCRSPRAPPPDFAAAWRHLAAAVCRGPGVSTGLPRLLCPCLGPALPASCASRPLSETRWSRRGPRAPTRNWKPGRETRLGLPGGRADASASSAPAGGSGSLGGAGGDGRY